MLGFMDFLENIPNEALEIGELLGEGEYGEVYLGRLRHGPAGPMEVAIKTLKTEGEMTEWKKKEFLTEARTMLDLEHPHIVQIIGICWTPKTYMVGCQLNFMSAYNKLYMDLHVVNILFLRDRFKSYVNLDHCKTFCWTMWIKLFPRSTFVSGPIKSPKAWCTSSERGSFIATLPFATFSWLPCLRQKLVILVFRGLSGWGVTTTPHRTEAGGLSSGTHRSPATTGHFHMPLTSGRMASPSGKSFHSGGAHTAICKEERYSPLSNFMLSSREHHNYHFL